MTMDDELMWSPSWPTGENLDPDALFDRDAYANDNPDVVAHGYEPIDHYRQYGQTEGRRPNTWFDPVWYLNRYLVAEGAKQDWSYGVADSFAFFCQKGAHLGHAPNLALEQEQLAVAERFFDRDFYLAEHQDVVEAGLDPWSHYLVDGWLESRDPNRWLKGRWYQIEHLYDGACNPLIHYVTIGRALGYATALAAEPEVASAETEGPVADQPPASDTIAGLLAIAEADRQALYGRAAVVDDDELLMSSSLFNSEYYRLQMGDPAPASEVADRAALVAHYLGQSGWKNDPTPEFSGEFYLRHYSRLPAFISTWACPPDTAPLVHYLRVGRRLGFYPNAQIASLEVARIRASGDFDADYYLDQLDRPLRQSSPLADYVFYGHLERLQPNPQFDSPFVSDLYRDLVGTPMHEPLAFFLENADRPYVYKSRDQLANEAAAIRACDLFDEDFYARVAGIDPTIVDPAEHYATFGLHSMLPASEAFDTEHYLLAHADIAAVRINPLLHYVGFGRSEGRAARGLREVAPPPGQDFDRDRQTVLVISHEASRTGAPIVALNIAQHLAKQYNIISWLGRGGPLSDEFAAVSIDLQSGWGTPSEFQSTLSRLIEQYGCAFAIVNSVVCHPIMSPLNILGVPTVSLIHEFADYVYPMGALSRMAFLSDVAVFPARIVKEACEDEMLRLGAVTLPDWLRVDPQGHNRASARTTSLTADEVRAMIGFADEPEPGAKPRRVLFGAGQVQPRKGVDLFMQAAQQLMQADEFDWRFMWVGSGYDPDLDKSHSVYLAQQLRRSGLSRRLFMIGEQPNLDPFFEVADIFFLSSRLDPFPNVALDSIERSVPVVCFTHGTGVADIEESFPFAISAVPFADTVAASACISKFARTVKETAAVFAGEERDRLMEALSFETYVEKLIAHAADAQAEHARHRATLSQIESASSEDVADAVEATPALYRIAGADQRRCEELTLARHLQRSTFSIDVRLEFDPVRLERAWPPGGVCGAQFGVVPGGPAPGAHVIHLHVTQVSDAELLFETGAWTGDFLKASTVVFTAANEQVRARLDAQLPSDHELLDSVFVDPLKALAHVASTRPGKGTSLAAKTLSFAQVGSTTMQFHRPRLRPEVLDLLSGLNSGASLACLKERSDTIAVTAARQRTDGAAVLWGDYAVRTGESSSAPVTYAPGFVGTYRRSALLTGIEAIADPLLRGAPGLEDTERMTLAAMLFANHAAQSKTAIQPLLRMH